MTVKFITRRFIMEYDPYLEDTYSKQELIDGQEVMINIMDTYDREDVDEADRYFKWADIVFVVYSITSWESFDKAREYIDACTQYQRSSGRDLMVALIGNKVDLERYREVSNNEGNALASETDCLFYETTAAEEFEFVQNIFHETVRIVASQHQAAAGLSDEARTSNACATQRNAVVTGKQSLKRPKSPKPHIDMTIKDGGTLQKKNGGSSFKLFNKSFKIFN
ncbi:ras-like protein family member 12 [Tubulanus polymorphus]|uniref:ras-like protein family member 12 n=1 Tax=Tubulanus polymorphus TaxID=672921 RepID=UPI003DA387E7